MKPYKITLLEGLLIFYVSSSKEVLYVLKESGRCKFEIHLNLIKHKKYLWIHLWWTKVKSKKTTRNKQTKSARKNTTYKKVNKIPGRKSENKAISDNKRIYLVVEYYKEKQGNLHTNV